jgi:putative ABC transport system permease protein
MRNPNPDYKDYKNINKKVNSAELTAYSLFIGGKTVEYHSSNVEGAFVIAVTEDYARLFNLEFEKGRFYSETEYRLGGNQVVLGYKVAQELFGNADPIGRRVKVMGRKCQVIGVLAEAGKDLINPLNFDEALIMSYELARKITNTNNAGRRGSINVKAKEGIPLEQLKDDITGVLRASRRLKPRVENNFALNNLSIISNALDSVFGVLGLAGWVIGAFAMFVGMFSVANIMFVSVKERTNIIGIKKALGAKRYIILAEFLTEAIILCLIGGGFGLALVWLASYGVSAAFGFEIFLSSKNLIVGVVVSIATGLLAGIIPALQASGLDPVVAIRQ